MTDHPGELAVQRRAGWTRAGWGSAGVAAALPAVAREFLGRQRMMIAGGPDRAGAVWAGLLVGAAGFVAAPGPREVLVDARPATDDPLGAVLARPVDLGLLALEPQTRRRMRINGRSTPTPAGIAVSPDQVFANCPKHIQRRAPADDDPVPPGPARLTGSLSVEQSAWVRASDTFFVATAAPGHGSDVSHRGGAPGFVEVVDDRRLRWPDYVGNSMYMTLGNLALAPEAGLLFVDWARGHTLQLTGEARVDWDPRLAARLPGALRVVDFTVRGVVETPHAVPLRWTFVDYFPHNPRP